MIYSYLDGRLGNILFEVVTGASLAKRMGVSFKAIPGEYLEIEYLRSFLKSIFRKIDFQEQHPENVEIFCEPRFTYSALPFKKDIVLKGYFQSEQYFDKELVRSLFEIDPETESYIRKKYGAILRKKTVGLHVRRGDYLFLEYKHPVSRMSYFKKAISCFDPDTSFLVLSDDMGWCKKHFKGERFYFVEKETPLVDLYLQTLCSHNIISNSSFSWWGAWLNPNPEKKVIYPAPWFGAFYRDKLNTKDLCPKEWIPVPISGKGIYYFRAEYTYLKKRIVEIRHRVYLLLKRRNLHLNRR